MSSPRIHIIEIQSIDKMCPKKKKTTEPESDSVVELVIQNSYEIYSFFDFLPWVPVGIIVSTHEDPSLGNTCRYMGF
jgi:hypothetical protein